MIGITIFFGLKLKSWVAPASVFGILWSVIMFLNVAFIRDFLVSAAGLWIVCLFVFCFGLGSVFVEYSSGENAPYGPQKPEYELPLLRFITVFLCLIGFCAILIIVRDHIGSTSGSNPWNVFHEIAIAEKNFRYLGVKRPYYFSLINMAFYSSALFGGLLFSRRISRSKTIGLAPLIVVLAYSLITIAKATLLQPLLLWISAYGAGMLLQSRNREMKLGISGIVLVGCLAIVISGIILFTFYLRYPDKSLWDAVAENILNYVTFGLPPFVYWWDNVNIIGLSPDYGRWTFSGIIDFLGLGSRELGIYKEFVVVGALVSNLCSALRGLIQDFTFPGAILVTLCSGALAERAYRLVTEGNIAMVGILAGMYSFMLWSPIVSLFVYNAILFAAMLFAFYCVLVWWIIKLDK